MAPTPAGAGTQEFDMTTKELLEQRAGLILAAQKLLDGTEEGRALTSEDEAKFDKLMADADAIDARMRTDKRREAVDKAARELEKPVGSIIAAAQAARGGGSDPYFGFNSGSEYQQAFRSYLRSGDNTELRVMSYGTAANGGYTVPETVEARIVEKLRQGSIVRQLGRTTVTPDDRKIPIQNAIPTAAIIGEGSSITASDATFTQLTVDSYKYATRVIASRELISDSGINLEEYVIRTSAEAIARAQDEHFWDGTDSGQPQGVIAGLTAAGNKQVLSTGQTTSITSADNVIDWVYKLPVQYRAGAVILTSDEVVKNMRKIKDANNNYIWLASDVNTLMAGGAPGTIMGVPYYISEYVDALAANKYVAVYGNFNYYEIYDRGATEIVVDPYSLSSTWQLQMVVVKRTDALRTLDEAFVTLQCSAT
jgi:HK97 family phage major capsid protein